MATMACAFSNPQDPVRAPDMFALVRANLPPAVSIRTPFGTLPVCYADYTASGRALACVETYISRVVAPLFANTHTETSATGTQTGAFREEARALVREALNAPKGEFAVIFAGSGSTAAIAKLIGILGLKLPPQLVPRVALGADRPLVLLSSQEHHSNELMWRECNTCDVQVVPLDEVTGAMDLVALARILRQARDVDARSLILGSFSAGSNVTGLRNDPGPICALMHAHGGFACFDFAAAAPYVSMDMVKQDMDAVFVSPHKFVGGPGTPGVLCVRLTLANATHASDYPPSTPGGGTVRLVWGGLNNVPAGVIYDSALEAREEAGTPAIVEAIRCGLVFSLRAQVGVDRIERVEGEYALRAVKRFLAHGGVELMGARYSQMLSEHRLSITSFVLPCVLPQGGAVRHPLTGKPLYLHQFFVATLLNDLFGIQARSGCSCAGPYGFRLFQFSEQDMLLYRDMESQGYSGAKIGWTRVNFNYFIGEDEVDFICSAIELVATQGWKLLPLYALCLRTGAWEYTGEMGDRAMAPFTFPLRSLREMRLGVDVPELAVPSPALSYAAILQHATRILDHAPARVRESLGRCRDFIRADTTFPAPFARLRFFALPSEVLSGLGITEGEVASSRACNSV